MPARLVLGSASMCGRPSVRSPSIIPLWREQNCTRSLQRNFRYRVRNAPLQQEAELDPTLLRLGRIIRNGKKVMTISKRGGNTDDDIVHNPKR